MAWVLYRLDFSEHLQRTSVENTIRHVIKSMVEIGNIASKECGSTMSAVPLNNYLRSKYRMTNLSITLQWML